jgi:hypothetical protein
MEERKKSAVEEAAYKAGLELASRRQAEQEQKQEAPTVPSVAYVLPTPGYTNTKASLN